MKHSAIRGAIGVAALAAASVACAAVGPPTVYRCGIDGRTFSDRPCSDGVASDTKVDVPDAARVGQARQVAEREAALADRLAVERRQREAHPGGGSGGFHARPTVNIDRKSAMAPKKRRTAKTSASPDEATNGTQNAPFEAKAAPLRK